MLTPQKNPVRYRLTIFFRDVNHAPKTTYQVLAANQHQLGLRGETLLDVDTGQEYVLAKFLDSFPFTGDAAEQLKWGNTYVSTVIGTKEQAGTSISAWGDDIDQHSDNWVRLFCGLQGFAQAYVVNWRFSSIQNETHASQLTEHYGESLAGYVVRREEYPPVDMIDCRHNPGRKVHRTRPQPYIEVVAGEMWFSDSIWPLLGKTRSDLNIPTELATISDFAPHVTKITAVKGHYADVSRASEMDALRLAIYGESILKFEKRSFWFGG